VPHIAIVGLMASGKTTVGTALAARLGWPYRDSDADILATTGRTARQIADDEGVEHLHDLELAALRAALARDEAGVIGVAASVIDTDEGRAALGDPAVCVIWLRVTPATIRERMDPHDHRPHPEPLEDQAARRDPWFAAVADVKVDTDPGPDGRDRTFDDVIDDVVRRVNRWLDNDGSSLG
jgi:shikimate kinase